MKLKIHYWAGKKQEAHYASFEFTPADYYIVKSMDVHDNEYRYSLNHRIRQKGITADYGYPVIFIEKEHADRLIKELHFVQIHNNSLY